MKQKMFSFSAFIIYGLLLILLLISAVPFYLVMINSTHSSLDIVTKLNLLPGNFLFENYRTMQSLVNIWQGFANSILITVPYTFFTAYFGALTALAFAKYSFPGKNFLFAIVLASMMIPAQVTIIGFYQLNLRLGLLNSYLPFVLPGMASAVTIFFLRGIIEQTIPDSLLESARIEGCSEFYIFNHLVLPCVTPGIAAMCIFNFVSCWNNYIGPLIIMTNKALYPLPVMIAMIKGLYLSNYGAMYLAIAISIFPVIILFCFFSNYIINGLTVGSDK